MLNVKISVIYDDIMLNSFQNEICFRQKLCRESKMHLYLVAFFSENGPVYEIMWKNMVEPYTLHV